MSKIDIIRAWKDESYRMSLTAEQQATLPANPAGSIELDDAQLDAVSAGRAATTKGSGSGCGGGSSGSGTGGNCCK